MRYLLITFLRKPGGHIDEQTEVSPTLKTRHLEICNIILDFKEKKVIKCLVDSTPIPSEWNTIRNYYHNIYPELIEMVEAEQAK